MSGAENALRTVQEPRARLRFAKTAYASSRMVRPRTASEDQRERERWRAPLEAADAARASSHGWGGLDYS